MELRYTEFPTRKQTFRLTNIVIIGSIVISIMLLAFDTVFTLIRGFLTKVNN